MKRLLSLVLMKICLFSLLLTAPAGAAISPCNQMSGSVSPDGFSLTLVVDDPRPDVNQWIYMYSVGFPSNKITNFNISNGIARWCEVWQVGMEFQGYSFHVLFDPDRGWKLGQSNYFNNLDVNSLTEANGVISVVGMRDYFNQVYFSTYDPVRGDWFYVEPESASKTPFLVNQDGIIAFFYDGPPNYDSRVKCYIYDYTPNRYWREAELKPVNTFSVEQACVAIQYGGSTTYWGYNPVTWTWQSGMGTQAKAHIYANPTRGMPPLWVWFWDLSLGALAKQWNFGDGTPLFFGGSCGHNYPNKGVYTVDQFVAGFPGGLFDETTRTIYVGTGQGNPAVPLLLMY